MAGEKLQLDDDGFALLGNALLLGYMVKGSTSYFERQTLRRGGYSVSSDDRERYCASERVELRDVLDTAGALGDWLYGPFNPKIENALGPLDKAFQRPLDVAASDLPIARLRLKDVAFSADDVRVFDLAEALQNGHPYELRTPLARLGPTALTRQVLALVLAYFRGEVARQMDISPAHAAFIGWDGVAMAKRLREPPGWTAWSSPSARAAQKEDRFFDALCGKAERLILAPIEAAFAQDGEGKDLADLGRLAVCLRTSITSNAPEFAGSLSDLGSTICCRIEGYPAVHDEIFPDYGARRDGQCYKADADPRMFLYFVHEQIGLRAAREGWAVCIAEDNVARGGGIYSWVPQDRFPALPDYRRIALPDALGVSQWQELSERVRREVGADRLWFALTRDLLMLQAGDSVDQFSGRPGPRTGAAVRDEGRAKDAIRQLADAHPGARLIRDDAMTVLKALGFGRRARERIWDDAAPKAWKVSGRVSKKVQRLLPDNLAAIIDPPQ